VARLDVAGGAFMMDEHKARHFKNLLSRMRLEAYDFYLR
jgi:hypothetical protein